MSNKLNIHFDQDFTVIPNQVFRDKRISSKAKGVFCTIISVPEDWNFSVSGLAALCTDGESAIKSAIQELEEHGYLEWDYGKNDLGQWSVTVDVFLPQRISPPDKTSTEENPERRNQDNKERTNKELTLIKKERTKLASDDAQEAKGTSRDIELSIASPKRERPRDPVWDALCDVCGIDTNEVSKSARGAINRACKEIRDVGGSPDDIYARAKVYKWFYPDTTMTPSALAKHWAQCKPGNERQIMSRKSRDMLVERHDEQMALDMAAEEAFARHQELEVK